MRSPETGCRISHSTGRIVMGASVGATVDTIRSSDGRRIRAARVERGWSLQQLADAVEADGGLLPGVEDLAELLDGAVELA